MTAKQLIEWLQEVPNPECRVLLEVGSDAKPLITAKLYDEDGDGTVDTIYLVWK